MAISSTASTQRFTADQTTSAFAFTFPALTATPEDIKCILTTNSTDHVLVYSTNYTVTVSTTGAGGTVNIISPSTLSKGTLTVYRQTTNLQASDYDDYNQFPANTLENDLDRRTLVSQEQAEQFTRTLLLPITVTGVSTTLPIPESEKVIGWSTGALSLCNYTNPGAAAGEAQSYATTALGYSTAASSHATTSITQATLAGLYAQTASQITLSGGYSLALTLANTTILTLPTAGTLTTEIAWYDYADTSTIVGWASYSSKYIGIKKIGSTVFCTFRISGTSNSTVSTFTLPYTAKNVGDLYWGGPMFLVINSGTASTVACSAGLPFNSNVVNLLTDMYSGTWVDSGAKEAYGSIWYESA